MDDACCATTAPQSNTVCPACGATVRPVRVKTVKALLTDAALARVTDAPHWFCADASCDVVYFDANDARYGQHELRVAVWQKQLPGNRTLCYCFGESEQAIREEILATDRSGALERIRAHIAAGRCACDVRNPRGACCLGDVAAALERIAAESFAVAASAR